MPSCFLNNQWRFCHVWHNPENRFDLSASANGCCIWARAQNLNGPIRVEDETTSAVVVDPITSLWGKPKRRILKQIFRSLRAFRPAKHTYLDHGVKFTGLCGTVGFIAIRDFSFLRRKQFVEWRLASDGWSGFFANRGRSRRGKNERYAVARRETRKRIASFKETKYDSSL